MKYLKDLNFDLEDNGNAEGITVGKEGLEAFGKAINSLTLLTELKVTLENTSLQDDELEVFSKFLARKKDITNFKIHLGNNK